MKRIILSLFAFLSILIIYSCKDYDFQNPIDPNITPANPNGLQVISFAENNLKVSWVDNEQLPVGTEKVVQFEYGFSGTDFTIAGYDTVENNEAEISTWFHCDTTYIFRISLYYGGNKTGSTSTIQRKLILRPTDLNVVFNSDTTASLTWKDNSTFEKEYEIEVLQNQNSVLITTVPANSTTAVIKWNYLIGKTYTFKLKGKSELNNSSYSTFNSSFALNAPTNLQITSFTETHVVLTWVDNSTFETTFEIEKSEDGATYSTVKSVGANMTTATIDGSYIITNQYSFRVRIKTSITHSEYSNIAMTPYLCGQAVVNYAGKIYNTIQIGSQCWLKENLNIGTKINSSEQQVNNSIIEKYCYGDDEANCTTFGGLYQWGEAIEYQNGATNSTSPSPAFTGNVKGICPTRWHIPALTEFETLKASASNDGNALKAEGQGTGSGAGTNTSGFSALLAGYRYSNGNFLYLGGLISLRSSTETDTTHTRSLSLVDGDNHIGFNGNGKDFGYSVRCLKD
ncbi:MAG: FISUMP domain-containing protein [bacterium]